MLHDAGFTNGGSKMTPLEKFKVNNLDYYKLAEFNNIVLAYHFTRGPDPSVDYVTWKHTGPGSYEQGHHYREKNDALNEQQSMRDFCVRSGLLRKCDLLANEELPKVSAVVDSLLKSGPGKEEAEALSGLRRQIDKILYEPKEMLVRLPEPVEQALDLDMEQ